MDPVLQTLQTALPSGEFAALTAWLSTFYAFQRRWVLEPARFALAVKARQIGFSHSTAAWAVLRAGLLGETTTVVSLGQRESDEVLAKSAQHAGALAELGSTWCRARPKGEALLFDSGGRILALPASSGGRGFTGNVVLDEAAYHGVRGADVWDAASAVTMHGYSLRVVSTPNGTGNLFARLATEPAANKGWSIHRVTIDDAIRDGMRVNLDDCWRMAAGDPRVFAQLFQGSFLDGAEQYLSTTDITAAIDDDACGQCQGDIYAGLDVGLVNDLSSLVIVRQDAYTGRCHIVDREDWKRTDWTAQQEGIEAAHRRWNFRRLCVDATGLGSVPAELLQKKLGRQRVEPVTFSSHTKEELATTLYQAFADRMVVMRRDRDLVDDLCAIRRIVTTGGAVRYDAERSERGHADRAWALALALYACSNKPARRNERGSAVA